MHAKKTVLNTEQNKQNKEHTDTAVVHMTHLHRHRNDSEAWEIEQVD